MVYVLKKNNYTSKGIVAFNRNEKDFFQKKFAQSIYKNELKLLKKKIHFTNALELVWSQ